MFCRMVVFFALSLMASLFCGCGVKDEVPGFQPDFEFAAHPSDPNVIVFSNTTQGEHHY